MFYYWLWILQFTYLDFNLSLLTFGCIDDVFLFFSNHAFIALLLCSFCRRMNYAGWGWMFHFSISLLESIVFIEALLTLVWHLCWILVLCVCDIFRNTCTLLLLFFMAAFSHIINLHWIFSITKTFKFKFKVGCFINPL